ncbi:Rhodanese-like protein, partial [Globisporangium splendens]
MMSKPALEVAHSSTCRLGRTSRLFACDLGIYMMATPVAATEEDKFVRIVPTQLAETLRTEPSSSSLKAVRRPLIIDVRGDDFKDGHITTAVSHPEPDFHDDEKVDALVEQYKHEDTIVFHCQMSQVRGPFCARRFIARLDAVLGENADKKPNVQVLTGGYKDFSEQFKDDTELLETSQPH